MDLLHNKFSPEWRVAEKNAFDMKSEVSQLPVNPSTDSTVNFLKNLLFEKPTQNDNEVEETDESKESEQDMTQEVETPIRSILVNREEADPAFFSSLESKQVRFAASPELIQASRCQTLFSILVMAINTRRLKFLNILIW